MSEIKIGVDWAKGDDKTCVVFIRKEEDDGTFTVIGELFGEAAEYVALLEAKLTAIECGDCGLTMLVCECDDVEEELEDESPA